MKTTSSTKAVPSSEHCTPKPCWGAAHSCWSVARAAQTSRVLTSSPAKLKMPHPWIHIHPFLSRSVTKTEEIQTNGPGNQNNCYLQWVTPTSANMGGKAASKSVSTADKPDKNALEEILSIRFQEFICFYLFIFRRASAPDFQNLIAHPTSWKISNLAKETRC